MPGTECAAQKSASQTVRQYRFLNPGFIVWFTKCSFGFCYGTVTSRTIWHVKILQQDLCGLAFATLHSHHYRMIRLPVSRDTVEVILELLGLQRQSEHGIEKQLMIHKF